MRWVKFNVTALISVLIVNASVFLLLVQSGVWPWLAMLIANLASTAFTFVMNHFVVFSPKDAQEPAGVDTEALLGPVTSASFFVPAHNEAENLPDVVRRIHEYFDGAGITERSVIVVDDGSTDNTQDVIRSLQTEQHPVTVVRHETNKGYGAALRSGFEAALATGHEWIAFCDSDGQFDPGDLDIFFAAAQCAETKVVLGYRANRADGWQRRMTGKTWHQVSQTLLGFKAIDVDCGFKLFHRDALCAIAPRLRGDYATISPELLARLHHAGHPFAEVAVPHYPRSHGRQSGLRVRVVLGSFAGLYPVMRELEGRVSA
jgi:glycosyltransferase involved in cell wall biosynthesis